LLVLCFLLGVFGVHRFYCGKIKSGIFMILTVGGLGIWALADFIIACFGVWSCGKVVQWERDNNKMQMDAISFTSVDGKLGLYILNTRSSLQ